MTLHSKPCSRGGCTGAIESTSQAWVAHRRFCSNRCAALERISRGTPMPTLTDEQRRVGGRKGGRESARKAKRKAALRWAAALDRYIPADIRDSLSARQLSAVRALMVKVGRAVARGRNLPPTITPARSIHL